MLLRTSSYLMKFMPMVIPIILGYQYNDEKMLLIKSSQEYGGYRRTKNLQVQATASLRWDIPWVKGLSAKALCL